MAYIVFSYKEGSRNKKSMCFKATEYLPSMTFLKILRKIQAHFMGCRCVKHTTQPGFATFHFRICFCGECPGQHEHQLPTLIRD